MKIQDRSTPYLIKRLCSPFRTPRMKMTRMPKKTLIAKRKLKEGYYDAGRRFCATQPFRSGQRQHLYALEQVLESGSPVFSRDRLYFITFFINLFLYHSFLSGSPVLSQEPTLFYHFQSVISERGPSRNDSIS